MRRIIVVLALLGSMLALSVAPAGAARSLDVEAVIDGRPVEGADSSQPIPIDPRREIPLTLTIRNAGDHVEDIRYVRLEGRALGLTFLTYDLGIRVRLRPGQETTVETALDFFDLGDQATGYLGTSLRIYDSERRLLGEQTFVVDVRGKATSTLGLFAIAVLGIAAFSVTVLVLNTVRRLLARNRFVRGLQFAVAGGAVGITLSLGVSILRITFADAEAWVPIVFLPTLIAFGIGYLAPGPLSRSIRDVREQEALEAIAEGALIRATGGHEPVIGANGQGRSEEDEVTSGATP